MMNQFEIEDPKFKEIQNYPWTSTMGLVNHNTRVGQRVSHTGMTCRQE